MVPPPNQSKWLIGELELLATKADVSQLQDYIYAHLIFSCTCIADCVTAKDGNGFTALHYAVKHAAMSSDKDSNYLKILKKLLDKGASKGINSDIIYYTVPPPTGCGI